MPRPGPRPYECVRRAWHSDRHQPIRGSIIQQIFRVVHERHSDKTKKNREWQEKLPVVVFKAEEIMYSKANSEAEYMDLDTLWDRVNEAIDMIIRKDESTETGELLPPCVEAALNLGCIPIRASRSQRHSNPRSYLSPIIQEPDRDPKILRSNMNERIASSVHTHSSNQSMSPRIRTVDSVHLASEYKHGALPNMSIAPPLSSANVSSILPVDSGTSLNVGSVYPVYYGSDYQPAFQQFGFEEPRESSTIIVGRPIYPSGPVSLFPSGEDRDVPCRISRQDLTMKNSEPPKMECDLSLRLGPSSDSGLSLAMASTCGNETTGLSYFEEGCGFRVKPSDIHKEFSFFPVESTNDLSGQHSRRLNSEGEDQFTEAADVQFFLQQGPTSNTFAGRMKRPGL